MTGRIGKGLFITFEGGEGSGKTTQIGLLAERLRAQGREVVTTREPGGTPDAEKIRGLLVRNDGGAWTPMAEVLLLYAARVMHVETLIRPALAAGKIVISDRFADSTLAYQGYGHGMDLQLIREIHSLSLSDFQPDMTFILDIPVEKGLRRAGKRLAREGSDEGRFEGMDTGFHERLRQGYLEIARADSGRCTVVDASRSVDAVAAGINDAV